MVIINCTYTGHDHQIYVILPKLTEKRQPLRSTTCKCQGIENHVQSKATYSTICNHQEKEVHLGKVHQDNVSHVSQVTKKHHRYAYQRIQGTKEKYAFIYGQINENICMPQLTTGYTQADSSNIRTHLLGAYAPIAASQADFGTMS